MIEPDWKPTACILCECNCGLEVALGGEDGRQLVKLRGDRRHPSSRGYACEKAHRLDHYQNGRDRLTKPLRRRADGSFEEIGWDVAIAEVAGRLSAVRDTHGGESIWVRLFSRGVEYRDIDHLTLLRRGFGGGSGSGILASS